MRKLLYIIVLCLLTVSCAESRESQIRKAVKRQMEDYPATTLLDLYKSFFQDNFGPGHMVNDTAGAKAYILKEIENATKYDAHYYEPAGIGENFYRVSLATIADSIVPLEVYFDTFISSVKDIEPVDVEQWRHQWAEILEIIKDMNLNLPNFDNDAAVLDSVLNAGSYAFHHSGAYNRRHHPHYRLIRKELFMEQIKPLIDSSRVY